MVHSRRRPKTQLFAGIDNTDLTDSAADSRVVDHGIPVTRTAGLLRQLDARPGHSSSAYRRRAGITTGGTTSGTDARPALPAPPYIAELIACAPGGRRLARSHRGDACGRPLRADSATIADVPGIASATADLHRIWALDPRLSVAPTRHISENWAKSASERSASQSSGEPR